MFVWKHEIFWNRMMWLYLPYFNLTHTHTHTAVNATLAVWFKNTRASRVKPLLCSSRLPLSGRWSAVWNIQCQTLKTRRRKKKKHLSTLRSPARAAWCGGLIKRVGGVEHDEVCSDSYFTPWTSAPLVDSCVCSKAAHVSFKTRAREPHTHRESWALASQ